MWQAVEVAPGGWRQHGVRRGPAARCYVGGDCGRERSSGTWLRVRAGISHFGILMVAFTYYIHSRFDGCESTAVKSFRGAVRAIRRTWSRTWHLMADTSAAEGPRGTIVWSVTAVAARRQRRLCRRVCAVLACRHGGQGIRTTNTEYAALPSCSHDMLIQIRTKYGLRIRNTLPSPNPLLSCYPNTETNKVFRTVPKLPLLELFTPYFHLSASTDTQQPTQNTD